MGVLIGLISDTHGLLRPDAIAALQGSDHIIHAGDIGSRSGKQAGVLETLAQLAPLTVVRGNNDRADWAAPIPTTAELEFDGVCIHVLHILDELAIDLAASGVRVVVSAIRISRRWKPVTASCLSTRAAPGQDGSNCR